MNLDLVIEEILENIERNYFVSELKILPSIQAETNQKPIKIEEPIETNQEQIEIHLEEEKIGE